MLRTLQKRTLLSLSLTLLLVFTAACNQPETTPAPPTEPAPPPPATPSSIALPNGFRPEGIASGAGTTLYAGSLADGAVYQTDVVTGEGSVLVAGEMGRINVGLTFDARTGYLFAAGGDTGKAQVYDTKTGTLLQTYTLSADAMFVNDAILSGDSVYFTDSARGVLYRLALGEGGTLPEGDAGIGELLITGAFEVNPDAMFNANGVEVAENGTLIIVNSSTGELFTIDPKTGKSALIDLGNANVMNGDGLLLNGNTLYVAQNQDNQIAAIDLADDLSSGTVSETITNPAFDIPTTLADVDGTLYAVNARFNTDSTADTEYTIVKVVQ